MDMQFIVSNQTEPYWNIAVENYLVEYAHTVTLYLWLAQPSHSGDRAEPESLQRSERGGS